MLGAAQSSIRTLYPTRSGSRWSLFERIGKSSLWEVLNYGFRIPERWQSGRMRRFAKPLYGLKPVPRVRIPPSPPLTHRVELSFNYCTVPLGLSPSSGAQVEHNKASENCLIAAIASGEAVLM